MENRYHPLLPRKKFISRLIKCMLFSFMLILFALGIGMLGYHHYEKMNWVDAFANASMILSGMGPFGPLATTGGKIFAGIYALFSGLSFIAFVSVILAPIIHRFLHDFHLEPSASKDKS